jgi:hypothetical protein
MLLLSSILHWDHVSSCDCTSDAMTKRQGYGPLSATLKTFKVFRSRQSLMINIIEICNTLR